MKVDEFGRPLNREWRPCKDRNRYMSWCSILKHKVNDRGEWLHKLPDDRLNRNNDVGLPSEILHGEPGSKWRIDRVEFDVTNGWAAEAKGSHDPEWMIVADRERNKPILFLHWGSYIERLWSPYLRVRGAFELIVEEEPPPYPSTNLHSIIMQDYWWHTRDGRWIPVKEMTLSHMTNLLAYLMRNARSIQHRYVFSSVWNNAPDEVDCEVAAEAGKSAEQFVRDLPIWQALEKHIVKKAGEPL